MAPRDVCKPGMVRPSFNCPLDAKGTRLAVHPDARLQESSHTPMPAEVACHGHPTWSFCLATIVKPASSISWHISSAFPAFTASGLIMARVLSSPGISTAASAMIATDCGHGKLLGQVFSNGGF